MKAVLIALLLLTTGFAVVAAAPTASACAINTGGDPLRDVEYCNATVGGLVCGQEHICL